MNVRPESLLKNVLSEPHNPLIANGFFRSGQIEAWGRGIEKMKNGCAADGLPEPEFEITSTMFSITFRIRNNNNSIEERKIYSTKPGGINGGINEAHNSIVQTIIENPDITTKAIAETLGFTRSKVEYHIGQLKKAGRVERVGTRKKGRWIIKQ